MERGARNGAWLAAAAFATYKAVRILHAAGNPYRFQNRTVLITGGSRGLGLILAREFGRRGARVAICARDEEELARASIDLESRGIQVLAAPCDITEPAQCDDLLSRVRDRFGRIDVLVNNAGLILVGPLELMTEADFDEAMRVHFYGPLRLILGVLPEMQARREGRILNVSSFGGEISVPHITPYCASKFALAGLSEGIRSELAPAGIGVTTVYPGLMRTGSHLHAQFKGQNKKEYTLFTLLSALPIASMNAEKAGRRIVEACRRGEARLVLPAQYAAATFMNGVAPDVTSGLLTAVSSVLPKGGGAGRAEGKESETLLTQSFLTGHLREAAREHNEAA